MNSIKSIKLENFQSYINTTIRPAPNGELSVVTGASDSGKTAILRALRWVFFNTPSGTDFIRVGATFARITVEFESGDTIIRWRSTGSINRYMVNGETYEGFGANVPFEVSHVSGISPVSIGDLNINLNLAEQLDGPFLGKSISAGARAKVLGKLAGTEEIDFAAKQLGTDLYRRNQDEKRLKSEVAGIEEEIKEYDWLPGMERKIGALEVLAGQIKVARERLMQLEHRRDRYIEEKESIYECLVKIERWKGLKQAESLTSKTAANMQVRKTLTSQNINYWACQKTIQASEETIKYYADIPDAERLLLIVQKAIERSGHMETLRTKQVAACVMTEQAMGILARLKFLTIVEPLLQDVAAKKQRRELLKNLSAKWTAADAAVIRTQKRLGGLSKAEEAGIRVAQVAKFQAEWTKLYVLRNWNNDLTGKIDDARGQAVVWENRVAELGGAYHDLLEAAGICPLCGATLSEMRIREVV